MAGQAAGKAARAGDTQRSSSEKREAEMAGDFKSKKKINEI